MSKTSLTDIILVTIGATSLIDLALAKINLFEAKSSFVQRLSEPEYLLPAIATGIAYGSIQLYKFIKDKKDRINEPLYKLL